MWHKVTKLVVLTGCDEATETFHQIAICHYFMADFSTCQLSGTTKRSLQKALQCLLCQPLQAATNKGN